MSVKFGMEQNMAQLQFFFLSNNYLLLVLLWSVCLQDSEVTLEIGMFMNMVSQFLT